MQISTEPPRIQTEHPRIIFVDDDVRILDSIRRNLRSWRDIWDVEYYDNPKHALDAIRSNPPDVAVLDIEMPELNGIDIAAYICKHSIPTLCIILTATKEVSTAIASINKAQVFRYYLKPCKIENLVSGIENALSHKRKQSSILDTQHNDLPRSSSIPARALDFIPYGVVVSDARGKAMFLNSKAKCIIRGSRGISLDPAGICRGSNALMTTRLHETISESLSERTSLGATLECDDEHPVRITVMPYQDNSNSTHDLVCIFVFKELFANPPDPNLLNSMFDLTIAEARLTAALVSGSSLDEAAEKCGITKSSARTYLKKIFAKLEVSRQSELVRKILLSIASL